MIGKIAVVAALFVLCIGGGWAEARAPLASDSRIRTFVYSANEVFTLTTEFGYQSNIEFAENEKILTLSVGDTVAFKITPSGNRLFVKALRNNSHTNMTLITTERSYQFELSSVVQDDRDIIYVMRFFYPREDNNSPRNRGVAGRNAPSSKSASSGLRATAVAKRNLTIKAIDASRAISKVKNTQYNNNYSVSGGNALTPVKVFDDGRATFFKFAANMTYPPIFYIVNSDGTETSIPTNRDGEYTVLNGVYPRVALRSGADITCIFNDKINPLTVASR